MPRGEGSSRVLLSELTGLQDVLKTSRSEIEGLRKSNDGLHAQITELVGHQNHKQKIQVGVRQSTRARPCSHSRAHCFASLNSTSLFESLHCSTR